MRSATHQGAGFDIRLTLNAHTDTATSSGATATVKHPHAHHGRHCTSLSVSVKSTHMASSSSSSQLPVISSDSGADADAERQVVLLTGCSSGIGHATALHFSSQGWRVCGTLRDMSKLDIVGSLETAGITVLQLDLADSFGIHRVISDVISKYGRLDALVSCAGHALVGALELCTYEQWSRALNVNVSGPLSLVGAALPYLRRNTKSRQSTAVLVSSALGTAPLPLTSAYAACKAALDAATLGAAAELKAVGVRIKVVLPGRVTGTHFIDNAERVCGGENGANEVYSEMTRCALEAMQLDDTSAKCSKASDVAAVLWEAVTDNRDKLRYVVGQDAKALLDMKQKLSDEQLRDELISRFSLN